MNAEDGSDGGERQVEVSDEEAVLSQSMRDEIGREKEETMRDAVQS